MIKAEYISHMGSDLTVVNSARVSFNKESSLTNEGILPMSDVRLIDYLATHAHITPFTHPQITLRETIPIFVARQRFKHVVGFTYNEISRRYVDDTPEFFVPTEWRSRPEGSVKQGSGSNQITHLNGVFDCGHGGKSGVKQAYQDLLRRCTALYTEMLESGIAPEQARMVLPQSMFTSYYVTGSLAAFARAYKQRIDSHAQKEIQVLAEQWDAILAPLYPVSWSALTQGKY